jgi:hypothetical protein
MFTLIFDTYSGLCNQMYDIQAAVNFCTAYNIPFSFRYSSLRESKDLRKWFDVPFTHIFDETLLTKFKLYKPFNTLKCSPENTHNYKNDVRAIEWLDINKAILPQLECIQKPHIVLRQFWSIPRYIHEKHNIYSSIKPCDRLMRIYNNMRDKLLPKKYNFIHYRYEEDFNAHFKITTPLKLCDIINHVKFRDKTIPTYIAANRVTDLPPRLLSTPINQLNNIIYKSAKITDGLNFEEAAFIDFMIGKEATEVYGHHNSSFSVLLNFSHVTNNYYDLEMT